MCARPPRSGRSAPGRAPATRGSRPAPRPARRASPPRGTPPTALSSWSSAAIRHRQRAEHPRLHAVAVAPVGQPRAPRARGARRHEQPRRPAPTPRRRPAAPRCTSSPRPAPACRASASAQRYASTTSRPAAGFCREQLRQAVGHRVRRTRRDRPLGPQPGHVRVRVRRRTPVPSARRSAAAPQPSASNAWTASRSMPRVASGSAASAGSWRSRPASKSPCRHAT